MRWDARVRGSPRMATIRCPRLQADAFFALAKRRRDGEPVAYLTGTREFWGLSLRVTPDVLIPRPETETLVELALEWLPRDGAPRVLDLGTGSGAIALAIAAERPRARVVATDASAAALAVARDNATRLALANVEFAQADWYDGVPDGAFDVIVSNPPYVAAGDPHLAEGDLRYEPAGALASGGGRARGIAYDHRRRAGAPREERRARRRAWVQPVAGGAGTPARGRFQRSHRPPRSRGHSPRGGRAPSGLIGASERRAQPRPCATREA